MSLSQSTILLSLQAIFAGFLFYGDQPSFKTTFAVVLFWDCHPSFQTTFVGFFQTVIIERFHYILFGTTKDLRYHCSLVSLLTKVFCMKGETLFVLAIFSRVSASSIPQVLFTVFCPAVAYC